MKVSWVILTRGDRQEELARAVASAAAQEGVDQEVVVVGNGADVEAPAPARVVALPDNAGIPGGRNTGVAETVGDVVFFLDDDARCGSTDLARRVVEAFAADDRLAVVTFRIVDASTGETMRRHVPRVRVGDPTRSSEVTTFLGGACAVRRRALDEVGGFAAEFFYSMEESDFAWRALDAGWRVEYRGDLVVYHPATTPARHGGSAWRTARNRVWLAKRRLPWPLAAAYVAVWVVLTLARSRSWAAARDALAGFRAGVREPAGERRPMRWATAWRMTRLGRPPVV